MQEDTGQFLNAVARAPLTSDERAELERLVAHGVTDEAWRRFDDLLVAALETRREAFKDYRAKMDEEVARYTEAYENEKRVIDQQMREDLANCNELESDQRKQLWDAYYVRIAELQNRVLDNMKKTSQTVLQHVVATVSDGK
ncbi:MAG: hypothetical protein V1738_03025 [Patescibacteria group bacterium]